MLMILVLLLVIGGNGAIIEPTLTAAMKSEITEYVNSYRRLHGSPDVAWDDAIMNAISQPWAVHLATDTSVTMEHTSASSSPSGTGYGENLAWFQGHSNDVMDRMKDSVDAWYAEIKDMDWSNPEPSGAHTGVVGHFTCLIWKDQQTIGFGYAYNDETVEINVDENTVGCCNIVGYFAENVVPPLDANDASTSATTEQIGIIVGCVVGAFALICLIWCQFPFLMDEVEKRPHVATDEENEVGIKDGEIAIKGATGLDTLFTCTEWCTITGVATRDCFSWYLHASLGGENACCTVLHEDVPPAEDGDEETGAGKKTGSSCCDKTRACCSLWGRATRACTSECWKEANEEIDHHEERKDGRSWCDRLCTSFCKCVTFYSKSLLQTLLIMYKYTRRCCIATHKAMCSSKEPKSADDTAVSGTKE